MDNSNDRYTYFVSYYTGIGFGCCEINLSNPIDSFKAIEFVSNLIKDDLKVQYTVVILYYQLLSYVETAKVIKA